MSLTLKSAYEISGMLKNKEISSEELTRAYLDRINTVEDKVEAYVNVFEEDAIKEAKRVDEKRAKGEELSELAGIPIAIKDNICTKGTKTTCSSKMLYNFESPYDATVSDKLKKDDLIILGKLNMDEFAMGSSTENSYFKKTKNPWDITRVPGGSSGGSAAAIAAREAVFTLGSDTGGSIRQPASYCGVVGMKPTYGAVSRYGLVAFASSLDQIGPITKDVKDMAMALQSIVGYDPMDSSSAKIDYPKYIQAIGQDVKGMKIALPREYFSDGIQNDIKEKVLEVAKEFEKLGAIVEEVDLKTTSYALPAYYLISSAEASSNLARYDGVKYGYRAKEYDNLLDLYKQTRDEAFGTEVKRRIMLGTYALSSGYYDAYYKKAQQVRTIIKNEFDQVFNNYDIILTPTVPATAFEVGAKIDNPIEMYMNDVCTVPVNIAGLPALSMNCGFDQKGLPIGVQFIGKAFDESTLLKMAYAYEQTQNNIEKYPTL
ncbi:aspartyl/glutamyl-tRNA(Asn/Gln) amidotransferase subunit A [Natranaerovirga hydrolytica]|uniref:Glutamyl-tRNA(Gln) amidotransferase subunit A n=1 Tax=Natranaerovirga hydrolytica TaxID=680378 RepID=A0A4R1MQS6_9FIRM|nr:Asp-tRNA(Asn)/Glu-tRNA(Gln) amidotransferase subunit GatA [Natranaerovirga hydrolytica]TCK92889.1 aspartyl/glutamyl-tRNA(Asn/Gln) amidotransferase subunit A [Natranaerovirga hydrolytica]